MDRLHEGVVEIEVDGETVEMRPTPDAIARIDDHFEGLQPAAAALDRSSPKAMAFVVCAGAGVRGKAARELAEKLMRPGFARYMGPAGRFLTYLFHGGRETPPEPRDDDAGEG